MENLLVHQGLFDAIILKDPASATKVKETDQKVVQKARVSINLMVDKSLHVHIRQCKTALEVWEKSHTTHII